MNATDATPPAVTVVVIGQNEGEHLARCLESVHAADYPADRIELIYVDSNSTDGSPETAEKMGAQVIRLDRERPTAAAGRNAGLEHAGHGLIQFLDGDTIMNPTWLRKAVTAINEPAVAGVVGRVDEVNPNASIYNFWAHHDWYIPPGPTNAFGGIALFRRDALRGVGGYDDHLAAGEERDLCFRLIRDQQAVLLSLDEPMALHDIHMTRFSQYWRRCVRTGRAYAEIAARYPDALAARAACRRNAAHVMVALVMLGLSLGFASIWPMALWGVLLGAAVLRNARRVRPRTGTLSSALLYSLHHYLSKTPMALGQCLQWFQRTGT